jgi:Rieske Fe-S protein
MKRPNRDCGHLDCPARSGVDRRAVLRAGAAGSLAIAMLPVACGSASEGHVISDGPIVFGPVANVPVGTLVTIPGARGFLGRDSEGLYAMSNVCTHQGGTVPAPFSMVAQEMTCPLHGSRFDRNGNVTRGPAAAPLQHYQVDLAADGTITIQGSSPVSSNTRTPVP